MNNNTALSELAKAKPLEAALEHEIQIRANELYEHRGKLEGLALDDWLKAEAEVISHRLAHN
jgi:hypothetical protein